MEASLRKAAESSVSFFFFFIFPRNDMQPRDAIAIRACIFYIFFFLPFFNLIFLPPFFILYVFFSLFCVREVYWVSYTLPRANWTSRDEKKRGK